jgi:SAM-dependent methyltransferase
VARSYDEIAGRWNDDGFPRDNGLMAHERAIAFLERKRHALDVGCGCSGRIIDLLLEHEFDVEGLDLSERMIELAKQRHPNVTFHHADICEWKPPREYDLISGWDSTWHVPLADQEPVLRKILGALAPGGVYIFTTGGLDGPSETVNSDMGPPMYYAVLGIPRTLEVLAECGCLCRHLEYDQHPELHAYLIAQKAGGASRA